MIWSGIISVNDFFYFASRHCSNHLDLHCSEQAFTHVALERGIINQRII